MTQLTPDQAIILQTAITYFFDRESQTFTPEYKEKVHNISRLLWVIYDEVKRGSIE